MVHNGIEYGLMQAYAEGFDILKNRAKAELPDGERYSFDLADVAEVWRRGSVVSSWLLDLTARALSPIPARAGGPSRRRWRRRCRPTPCRRRSTSASARARTTRSASGCCR